MKNRIPKMKYDPLLRVGEYGDIDILNLIVNTRNQTVQKVLEIIASARTIEINSVERQDPVVAKAMNEFVKKALDLYRELLVESIIELKK